MRFRTFILIAALVALASVATSASAQTSSGTMGVTATVQGSIGLTLATATGGVALGSSGTNAVTLAFGNISAYGTLAANVSRSLTASDFTVSTPFMVVVQKYNSASGGFSLTGQLASAPGTETWKANTASIINGSATAIYGTGTPPAGAYGSTGNTTTLYLTVPNTVASGAAISNTINFTASAN